MDWFQRGGKPRATFVNHGGQQRLFQLGTAAAHRGARITYRLSRLRLRLTKPRPITSGPSSAVISAAVARTVPAPPAPAAEADAAFCAAGLARGERRSEGTLSRPRRVPGRYLRVVVEQGLPHVLTLSSLLRAAWRILKGCEKSAGTVASTVHWHAHARSANADLTKIYESVVLHCALCCCAQTPPSSTAPRRRVHNNGRNLR